MRRSIRRKWMCQPMRASKRGVFNQVLVQPSAPSALRLNSASLLGVSSFPALVDLTETLNLRVHVKSCLSPAQTGAEVDRLRTRDP